MQTLGRKTGRPHSVILRYVFYDGKIVVFPQPGSTQDWFLNVTSTPAVSVYVNGRAVEGEASVKVATGVDDPLLSAFTRKYGDKVVRQRYWGQTTYVEIEPRRQSLEDVSELVYGDLEAAFDGVAEDYDRHIFGNPVNVWLRNRSVGLMTTVFRRGQTVLEIGCGTGTETLSLAKKGIRVIATDISSKMLEVLTRHARDAGLQDLVVPVHCRPYALREKLTEIGYAQVDGAYSTYGAVNTEPRFADFFANLHSVLAPDGKLILGVWNKYCLYELAGYALKGNLSLALARLKNPVPVGKSRFCVATNAYSVGSLASMLGVYFTMENAYAVCLFIPPSNLLRYLPPAPLLAFAKDLELRIGDRFPWNRLGDHFLGVYRRNA